MIFISMQKETEVYLDKILKTASQKAVVDTIVEKKSIVR
jgi:hypothetical protein